jgi:hypothetical protein
MTVLLMSLKLEGRLAAGRGGGQGLGEVEGAAASRRSVTTTAGHGYGWMTLRPITLPRLLHQPAGEAGRGAPNLTRSAADRSEGGKSSLRR